MGIKIIGSYITKFGELFNRSLTSLLNEATFGAIKKAKIAHSDIEAIFVANKAAGGFENQLHLSSVVSYFFDHYPPAMRIESACASGGLAILAAETALLSGQYRTVLVVGAEKMTDASSCEVSRVLSSAADFENERGSTFPGLYALLADAHMDQFKTTREQLSSVSAKNHKHALDNPKAHFHKKFSLDQVSSSVLVADPLRLLDCSPISDGAAAVVLTVKKVKNKPKILGFGHGQDSIDLASRKSLLELPATKNAAQKAFSQARLTPNQINVAEVHDCFTIAEILATEDLGFFKKGKGGQAALEGLTTYEGEVVINPSGGLKACGHPVGATGVKQVAFLAELIESRKFKYGLAHNVGGSGATAVVHILGL